jgi:hypothetical protein
VKNSIESIITEVKKYFKACKNDRLFHFYQTKISRQKGSDGQKKIAVIRIANIMEVKP